MNSVFGFLCSRPAKKAMQQRTMEDIESEGPKWVKDDIAFWCCDPACNIEFSVFVRRVRKSFFSDLVVSPNVSTRAVESAQLVFQSNFSCQC